MKSIRRSLIVYFLLLLTVALGAVSWTSYRSTAQALRAHQSESKQRLMGQYDARSQAAHTELDQHILRQARTLANMSRSVIVHSEGLLPFGAVGAAMMPNGHMQIPIWL